MLATPPASSSSISLTLDELRWLEASAIIELTPSSSSASLTHSVIYDGPRPSHASIKQSNSPYGKPQPHLYSVQSLPSKPLFSPSPSRGLKHPLSLQPTPPATPPRRSSPPTSPPTGPLPPTPGSAEWIYRRPKSPVHTRARSATVHSPYRPRARPQTGYHSHKPSSPPHTTNSSGARIRDLPSQPNAEAQFWTGILRPRSRSERSMPALKTIPSQSQIALTEPPSPQSESMSVHARSQVTTHRPPSDTSSISSTSSATSHSSSRLETPLTPSLSSSPYNYQRPSRTHQRRSTHPGNYDPRLPPLSASSPPSKSILTRTSSISTKGSASVSSKSVKFAEMPTVHYTNKGQWNLATIECREDDSMGMDLSDMDFGMEIDVDSVDSPEIDTQHPSLELHHSHIHHHQQRSHHAALRELQCSTPTPEKERKSRGLRRLIDLATSRAPDAISSTAPPRPSISSPFALGTLPPPPLPSHSTTSFRRGQAPLRSAPSLESFRSARSVGGRSVKSVGSVKSTASTRGFRAWLGGLWRDA